MSRVLFVLLLAGVAPHGWRQPGGDIRMLCSTAFKRVMEDLGPRFERATGIRPAIQYGTSASLTQQIEQGQPVDLAVLTPDLIDRLVAKGAIVAETRTSIARAPMALAIRSGTRKPDVTTTGALTATLIAARSIAYAREGAAGLYFSGLIERLGIAEAVRQKSVLTETGLQVSESVATGRAEMGVLPLSEIVGVSGLDVLGAFPHDVQGYAIMVAGIATAAANRRTAQDVIDFLTSPEAAPAIEHAGMERPPK
jgi:molybdate transport system substrate-binding protein